MSDWIDDDFALQVFSLLPRFRQVSHMPMRLNARCPICGDSQKDALKARFYYYYHEGTAFVNCFNCSYSASFGRFLSEHDADAHKRYQMEKFKAGNTRTNVRREIAISPKITASLKIIEKLNYSERLDTLPADHPIVKYVESRKIPKDKWNRLWFTTKWQELANSIKPGTFDNPKPEPRLVIPIYNRDGKIESLQGRALRQSNVKYMTLKASDNASKIYGQDTVNEKLDFVFVMEGPIDSLFLTNAIAITGGSLNLDMVPWPEKRIWVMDNEPRHKDTIARMQRLIDEGETVCFWDAAPWQSKDVNDMVAKEGADPKDVQQYILDNSVSGLMARMRMVKYCKI